MDHPGRSSKVFFPDDRKHYVWLRWEIIGILAVVAIGQVAAAWGYYLIWGLPHLPSGESLEAASEAAGFPAWVRLTHYLNFFFLTLMARSGLQILYDHPRLYWTVHSTPGKEWIRFTPVNLSWDRYWTAKDDARYLTPWIGLPGYRHTIGMARHWHFMGAVFWLLNGLIFVVLLFSTDHWKRLVPRNLEIFKNAWGVFVHYMTFHMPPEPNGFYQYNALQQLTYFSVIFILVPMMILTGLAMSPSIDNRFKLYQRFFINKQVARSLHFIGLAAFLGFVCIHVFFVILTGLARNMNHMVFGTDDQSNLGIIIGGLALALIPVAWFVAHRLSWFYPRQVQHLSAWMLRPIFRLTLDRLVPRVQYSDKDLSPYFWRNGKVPEEPVWKELAKNSFVDYRLKVHGSVECPMEFSLQDLREMKQSSQITMHHCIQGWTGIAKWTGVPMAEIAARVRPKPETQYVAFWSYGEGLFGGYFYEVHSLAHTLHPQTILAYDMNNAPLKIDYGAPLRLRIENKLGFKMVKWICHIEFLETYKTVGKGEGGKNEDDEYFGFTAEI